jgi:hypothetical protein
MAEEEVPFEQEVISSLYGRMQQDMMARYGDAATSLTGVHKNLMMDAPEGNMADILGKQAGALGEAESTIGNMQRPGKGSSRGARAAAVEQGVQDKMRALGLLDQAVSEGDTASTRMVAEYVDPLTGELVDAKTMGDASPGALSRASQAAIESAEGLSSFASLFDGTHFDTSKGELSQGLQNTAANLGLDLDQGTPVRTPKESFWAAAFGENAADMKASYDKGRIDFDSMMNNLEASHRNMQGQGREIARRSIYDEVNLRRQAAMDQANAFNAQESYAQGEAQAMSEAAARKQQEIRTSIQTDKQNLARQGHGEVGDGGRKARLDYGTTGIRPI